MAVATAPACTFGCVTICPTVYLSEGETLDIVQEQFAAHGYTLQSEVGSGPMGLPFEPDLANWDAGLIAEIVTEEECPEYQQAAEELLAKGNERCGIEDSAVMTEPRQRSYNNCVDLAEGNCYSWVAVDALEACLNFACADVAVFAAEPAGTCEDDPNGAERYMREDVDRFIEEQEGSPG